MLQVQPTPNPNSLKIIAAKPLVAGTLVVVKPDDAKGNALALELLALEGVRDLFFAGSFVTVSKTDAASWDALLPRVEAVFRKHVG